MFNIQVEKEALAEALNDISSTIGANVNGLGDDCISLKDNGNYILDIYTTNTIEFSKISLAIANGSSGKAEQMPYINFKRFKTMIDSIPDGEYVNIKSSVNDIEITYGTRKKPLKLSGATNGMMQLPQFNSQNTISIDRKVISKALNDICSIIKDDSNNVISNCMRIYANGFDVEITAMDTKYSRMYMYSTKQSDANIGEVLVEANKLKKAFKLFERFNSISFETNGTITKIYGTDPLSNSQMFMTAEYYVRSLSGNFPKNISVMFGQGVEFSKINKAEIIASISRADAIEDNVIGSGTLELAIKDDMVNIVKTSQYGVVEDSFSAENVINTPIKDMFKAKALIDVVKCMSDQNVQIGRLPNASCYVVKDGSTSSQGSFIISAVNANIQTP